ncbi:MAG: hypothetical protein K9W45_04155 [Candidatus Heimdallarchaeum aukensis]|uniref:Uncharacterized protein n=1 Tax=Candidatus Heimdallarchaeum aukensis TaxID=2876573 RepID=A0A9Y1BMD2_9ARCH|nr:MAG: hypothetical protein K9W45_04155 [Candidatus Heimdallarchaeum aukensis]
MMQTKFPIPYSTDSEREEFIDHMFCPICKLSSKKDIVSKSELEEQRITYIVFTLRCDNCDKLYEVTFFDENQIDSIEKLKTYSFY